MKIFKIAQILSPDLMSRPLAQDFSIISRIPRNRMLSLTSPVLIL